MLKFFISVTILLAHLSVFAQQGGLGDQDLCVIPSNAPANFIGPVVTVENTSLGLQGALRHAFYWHGPMMQQLKKDDSMYGVLAQTEIVKTVTGQSIVFSGIGFSLSLPNKASVSEINEGDISIDMNGWTLHQKVKAVLPLSKCFLQN